MCNVAICLFIAIVFVSFGTPIPFRQQSKCVNNQSLSREGSWNCVEREQCEFSDSFLAKNVVSCGAQSICCPSSLTKTDITHPTQEQIREANSVALNECHKYQGYRFHNYTDNGTLITDDPMEVSELDCKDDVQVLVANGKSVDEKEYPFMALLGYSKDVSDGRTWRCGGTLISSQYILTAAHCTKNEETLVKWALLGRLFRTDITPELKNKNLFKVIERINHPLYKAGKSENENNDIALLKLEREVPLSSSVRPICLYHDQTMVSVNSTVMVAGWGVKVEGEIESDDLQKAPINVLEESRCVDQFNGFNKTTMVCGGDLKNKERDSCPGDSGGPMLIGIKNYTCMYLQVGVISQGSSSCGYNTPTTYTRVSHYLPWIRRVAWSST